MPRPHPAVSCLTLLYVVVCRHVFPQKSCANTSVYCLMDSVCHSPAQISFLFILSVRSTGRGLYAHFTARETEARKDSQEHVAREGWVGYSRGWRGWCHDAPFATGLPPSSLTTNPFYRSLDWGGDTESSSTALLTAGSA